MCLMDLIPGRKVRCSAINRERCDSNLKSRSRGKCCTRRQSMKEQEQWCVLVTFFGSACSDRPAQRFGTGLD